MWYIYAVSAGLFFTLSDLFTRHILRQKKDAWAYSFYLSFIGAMVSLPFMLENTKIADSLSAWALMFLAGGFIVIQNFLSLKAVNYLEVSVGGVISKFRLVWILVLGLIVLRESFTLQKLAGTLLTVIAGWLLIGKFNKPKSLKGSTLMFFSTFFYAVVILLYKYLFSSFNSASLTFFIFLIPAVINLFVMPDFKNRISTLMKESGKLVVISCVLRAFANLAMNQALFMGEISKVVVIIEASLITTLVGEYVFLKERDHTFAKVAAVVIVVVGAILIRLSP